jgi:phage pi2 protein 07
MTVSFEPYGATVSPDSTMDDMMGQDSPDNEEQNDILFLTHLQRAWNRLDLAEFAPIFQGNTKRRLYLKDMVAVRNGGMVYYSLGGQERQAFSSSFLTLSRRLQQIFIQCATSCLHENRFVSQADLMAILQEGKGKRQQFANTEEQHRNKRQRSSFDGIQCFA